MKVRYSFIDLVSNNNKNNNSSSSNNNNDNNNYNSNNNDNNDNNNNNNNNNNNSDNSDDYNENRVLGGRHQFSDLGDGCSCSVHHTGVREKFPCGRGAGLKLMNKH